MTLKSVKHDIEWVEYNRLVKHLGSIIFKYEINKLLLYCFLYENTRDLIDSNMNNLKYKMIIKLTNDIYQDYYNEIEIS